MSVLNRWLKQNQEVDVLDIDLDTAIELFDTPGVNYTAILILENS